MSISALKVTSHVGRDLLQSAQLFRHEHAVVWEYVSNGLQYKDPATKPTVIVSIDPKQKSIEISDNGRGMLLGDLQRYFQMHGENIDRKQGRPGRGFFGTGKCAAFGIGNSLTITTVRDGKQSKVRLTRDDILARPDGDEIPVEVLEREVACASKNGTRVQIENVFLRKIDIGSVIRHIERHVAYWPDATVVVNNHECELAECDINREIKLSTKGSEFERTLGETSLTIKVAKSPLEEELRGIAVLSNGVWHETTLAGCERKPFAEYLFGSIDVPALDSDQSPVAPFDMSRQMKLNPGNEVVADIYRFVGMNVEKSRKELEAQDRERRQTEEQKRFERQASKIADLINDHFKEWSTKLRKTLARSGRGQDLLNAPRNDEPTDEAITSGDELPAILELLGGAGDGADEADSNGGNPLPHRISLDEQSDERLAKRELRSSRNKPLGGFNVKFDKLGEHEKRAKYDKATRTIYINLEHPRIVVEAKHAMTPSAVDDPNFLRMAYEVAFTEYAIVLGQELSSISYYLDPQDALVDVRQTLDELSKTFAAAWSTSDKR